LLRAFRGVKRMSRCSLGPKKEARQLVLLSIIMVGQKIVAAKSDRQLEQTYKDAEAMLKISDEIHCLLKQNTELTEEINQIVRGGKKG
jgi:hypothetical protein